MIKIMFYKVHATGNDFILIDNLTGEYNFSYRDFSILACDRHKGIGADGLLVIEKSDLADFKMRYLNSDGSEGGMCGNGGRVIAKYASNILKKNNLNFEALNYIYSALIDNNHVLLKMKNPEKINQERILFKNHEIPVWFIDTGAPHTVIFLNDLAFLNKKLYELNILEIGKFIRNHKIFQPEGTNVNIVDLVDNNTIKIRTYERGVENETLSCGTGAIACSIISFFIKHLSPPIKVLTTSRDEIIVNFEIENSKIFNVSIQGSTSIVFKGEIFFDPENKTLEFNSK